jgi:hypothetical protein
MALLPTVSKSGRTRSSTNGGSRLGGNFMSYPKELGTMARHEHYVMFYINAQAKSKLTFPEGAVGSTSAGSPGDATTLTIQRAPTKRLAQSIALYMPAQLSVGHTAKYGEAEVGAAIAGANALFKGIANKDISTGDKKSNFMNEVQKYGASLVGQEDIYDIVTGTLTNNRTEMKFEGIERRDFSFSFRMLPTSPEEAQTIEDIVTAFRFHSMPEFDGGLVKGRTMIVPSTFDIEYRPNIHLHKISTSVLESVEVQYGGERTQFFTDDQPVETQLTLKFKELEIITKERILEGY